MPMVVGIAAVLAPFPFGLTEINRSANKPNMRRQYLPPMLLKPIMPLNKKAFGMC